MSTFHISIKNKDGKYEHVEVPESIALYIKQLEHYIQNPRCSKLKGVYPDRFRTSTLLDAECCDSCTYSSGSVCQKDFSKSYMSAVCEGVYTCSYWCGESNEIN